MITYEKFLECTGHAPVDDDLERCNCIYAGSLNHMQCGWNNETDLPIFMSPIQEPETDET